MLKLKFLFALGIMQMTMSAWGQASQPMPTTSPVGVSAPSQKSLTSKDLAQNQASQSANKEILGGEIDASGLVCTIFTAHFDLFSLGFVLSFHSTYKV